MYSTLNPFKSKVSTPPSSVLVNSGMRNGGAEVYRHVAMLLSHSSSSTSFLTIRSKISLSSRLSCVSVYPHTFNLHFGTSSDSHEPTVRCRCDVLQKFPMPARQSTVALSWIVFTRHFLSLDHLCVPSPEPWSRLIAIVVNGRAYMTSPHRLLAHHMYSVLSMDYKDECRHDMLFATMSSFHSTIYH